MGHRGASHVELRCSRSALGPPLLFCYSEFLPFWRPLRTHRSDTKTRMAFELTRLVRVIRKEAPPRLSLSHESNCASWLPFPRG